MMATPDGTTWKTKPGVIELKVLAKGMTKRPQLQLLEQIQHELSLQLMLWFSLETLNPSSKLCFNILGTDTSSSSNLNHSSPTRCQTHKKMKKPALKSIKCVPFGSIQSKSNIIGPHMIHKIKTNYHHYLCLKKRIQPLRTEDLMINELLSYLSMRIQVEMHLPPSISVIK